MFLQICERNNQKWVEDPTNRSSIFTRNRIRMALQDMKTCAFRSELQALISVCRRTRLYVDHICQVLLNQAVTIMPHGYAVIDLEKLNPSQTEDLCLSRFLALVLQFVSQRHRPVRGSALKLLLGYIRTFPCKLLAPKELKSLFVAQSNPFFPQKMTYIPHVLING